MPHHKWRQNVVYSILPPQGGIIAYKCIYENRSDYRPYRVIALLQSLERTLFFW